MLNKRPIRSFYAHAETCWQCRGSGRESIWLGLHNQLCTICNGTGNIARSTALDTDFNRPRHVPRRVKCPACKGHRWLWAYPSNANNALQRHQMVCPECNGMGWKAL